MSAPPNEAKWKKLWESGKLASSALPELKDYLRAVKLPMTGVASTLAQRVGMHMDVKYLDLFVTQDGVKQTPFELKAPALRKIVAQLGMDPTGDNMELQSLLIEYLKKKKNTSTSGSSGSSASASGSGESQGVMLAKQILEMSDDYPAVLSTSGLDITPDSSVATMRKAYLKLSLLIHPDKLVKTFPDATKAFQALVTAYERLSQPELFMEEEEDEDDRKKPKTKTIQRSNEGCFRTNLYCPRCKAEWGLPDSGVEPYDYNFMMLGLRTFHCAACLCEFGCMTAEHECPHCRASFEYHPNDYHRKINCSSPKCKKPFGFFIFNISAAREKEYRADIRSKQEKRLKEKEQLEARAKRAKGRGAEEIGSKGKAKLFVLNLLDRCPRCGDEVESGDITRLEHLKGCNDSKKIAAYAQELKKEQEFAQKKKAKQEAQEEVENVGSWEFLGGKAGDMWLLTEKQLLAMAKTYGMLEIEGLSKDELITRLVSHRNKLDSARMLTAAGEIGEAPSASKKRKKLNVADMPQGMESMSVGQLKAIAASYGIASSKSNKDGLIKDIEKAFIGDEPFLMLK